MSAENVALVRRIVDLWSAGEDEAAFDLLHPEIQWHEPADQPGRLVAQGHSGVGESLRNWTGAWDDYRFELLDLIDAGDKVLAVGYQSGRGKGSQVEVRADFFHLWTVREGKAVEMRMFTDRDEAFEAAGLRGPAASPGSPS